MIKKMTGAEMPEMQYELLGDIMSGFDESDREAARKVFEGLVDAARATAWEHLTAHSLFQDHVKLGLQVISFQPKSIVTDGTAQLQWTCIFDNGTALLVTQSLDFGKDIVVTIPGLGAASYAEETGSSSINFADTAGIQRSILYHLNYAAERQIPQVEFDVNPLKDGVIRHIDKGEIRTQAKVPGPLADRMCRIIYQNFADECESIFEPGREQRGAINSKKYLPDHVARIEIEVHPQGGGSYKMKLLLLS